MSCYVVLSVGGILWVCAAAAAVASDSATLMEVGTAGTGTGTGDDTCEGGDRRGSEAGTLGDTRTGVASPPSLTTTTDVEPELLLLLHCNEGGAGAGGADNDTLYHTEAISGRCVITSSTHTHTGYVITHHHRRHRHCHHFR